jgi:beta-mannosidase
MFIRDHQKKFDVAEMTEALGLSRSGYYRWLEAKPSARRQQDEAIKLEIQAVIRSARCAMALNWCYNEPWPSAANNSLVNWPAEPKRAYFAVQAACRPVLASARIPQFQWRGGELFSAELWLLSDHPGPQPAGELVATLECGGGSTELLRWHFPSLAPQQNLAGPSVRLVLPDSADGEFTLVLSVVGCPDWNSRYRLSVLPSRSSTGTTTRALNT